MGGGVIGGGVVFSRGGGRNKHLIDGAAAGICNFQSGERKPPSKPPSHYEYGGGGDIFQKVAAKPGKSMTFWEKEYDSDGSDTTKGYLVGKCTMFAVFPALPHKKNPANVISNHGRGNEIMCLYF